LEQRQATLTTLTDQQQQLFLLVVQRFAETINEWLSKPAAALADVEIKMEEGVQADPTSNPNWLKWVSERFEDVLLVVS
jgi:hypothetical protein